jgi:ketosteroid isomerase-like protein
MAATIERLLSLIGDGRWNDLAALYAADARVELPFALPEPTLIVGRAALAGYFRRAATGPFDLRARQLQIREAADVVIAEYLYDVTVRETGRQVTTANVQVITFADGLIATSRDYHDHFRLMRSLSRGE